MSSMFDKHETPEQAPRQQSQQQDYNKADPFARVGDSDGREGGIYPVPGVYPVLCVDTLKMITSRKGDDLFIAELEIVQSEVPERPVGTRMSYIVNFKHDPAPGNVKTFLAKVMDVTFDEVDAAGAKFACSDKNPCHGRLVRLEASNTVTKVAKKDFTVCTWGPIPDDIQARARDLRKEAGFEPF